MKNLKLMMFILLLAKVSVAQTNTLPTSGNVGIGTLSPQAKLDIFSAYEVSQTRAIKMFYQGSWGYVPYASAFRFLDISSTEGGKILQLNGYGMGIGYDPPVYASADKLYVNGNVGIGTNAPVEKLSVNGKIRAHEIKVETTNWPDYVFEEGYHLTSLKELEKYIGQNKHLPDMPSAKKLEADGLELGEMVKLQQKKIEELTLHLIEKDKALKNAEERITKLEGLVHGIIN